MEASELLVGLKSWPIKPQTAFPSMLPWDILGNAGSRDWTCRQAGRPRKNDRAELKDAELSICETATIAGRYKRLCLARVLPTQPWPPRSLPRAKAQAACRLSPWLWPRALTPARKGDLQGGPTVTTEAACQPPERLGQPSAIPSVHPPGLSRLQMRSLQLDPKEGRRLCKAPLPSPFQTKGSRSSKGWWVGAEKAGTLSPREGFGTITCPSPAPKDPESSREELWAPASQPRAQCRLTSLGESWALVWGQSGTKVLEKGQDTQSGMAMPHNAPAPASTEATW